MASICDRELTVLVTGCQGVLRIGKTSGCWCWCRSSPYFICLSVWNLCLVLAIAEHYEFPKSINSSVECWITTLVSTLTTCRLPVSIEHGMVTTFQNSRAGSLICFNCRSSKCSVCPQKTIHMSWTHCVLSCKIDFIDAIHNFPPETRLSHSS